MIPLSQRLERVNEKIDAATEALDDVWFEFEFKGLEWKRRGQGKPFAIFYNSAPIYENPLEMRLRKHDSLSEFVAEGLRLAHEKLDEAGL